MWRLIYSGVLYLAIPFILIRLFFKGRRSPAYHQRIPERFAHIDIQPQAGGVWVHAVSVGESNAAIMLIKALRADNPRLHFTVTCMTPTGSQTLLKALGDSVSHCYLPYDLPHAMARFFGVVRPAVGIIMETELWPNMVHVAHQNGVKLMVANMRLSQRSANGYAKIRRLLRPALQRIDQFAVQTSEDAERLGQLGAPQSRISICGNIKFDLPLADESGARQQARIQMLGGRPVWIAGSTHEGEDQPLLQVHQQLLEQFPDLLLILVPRHPERFDAVFQLTEAMKLKTVRHSLATTSEGLGHTTQIYLLDTMGELGRFIELSDIAFIGGSLVPTGGHNVLEACAAGVPVICGPHMHNFSAITKAMLNAKAGAQITHVSELKNILERWLADAALRATIGNNGVALVRNNQGSLARHVKLIHELTFKQEGRNA